MSEQKTEYQNDHIKVEATRRPGSNIHLTIEVSPSASENAYQQSIRSINKEASMPGFRKGKAPASYIEQKFPQQIQKEWQNQILDLAYKEALELTNLRPMSRESIKNVRLKKMTKEGSTIEIEFEAYPEIPEVKMDELAIDRLEPKPVTDEDKQKTIEDICLHHAQWDEVQGRGVQMNDWVTLDIENLDNDTPLLKDGRFQVKEGEMGKWLMDLTLGKQVNEVAEGMSEQDHHDCEKCEEGEHHHHAEFKPTRCKVTIKKIESPTLPEVNDELAKKVGADNLDDLHQKIASSLEKTAQEKIRAQYRNQLEKQLLEKYTFDIPASLVENEGEAAFQDAVRDIQTDGKSEEEVENEKKQLRADIYQDIENGFRLFFLTQKVANQNHIDVSHDEIMKEFMQQMMMPGGQSLYHPSMKPEEIRSRLYSYLISKKAKDFLIDKILG